MTDAVKAVYRFLAGFGVPVYNEDSVPEDAVFPYLTFTPVITPWDGSTTFPVRAWDHTGADFSASRLYGLVDRIGAALDDQTLVLPAGAHRYVTLAKGDPWAQPQPMQDAKARVVYLNFSISTII